MIPKILGIGAATLSVAFILALPTVFEAEPANDVEPIRFGPRPVLKLAGARRVEEPPSRPEPSSSQPAAAPALPPPPPVAVPSEETTGESADTGSPQSPPEEEDDDEGDEGLDDEGEGDD